MRECMVNWGGTHCIVVINQCVRIIKYWGKIIQSDNVLIKFLYNEMFIAYNNGVKIGHTM